MRTNWSLGIKDNMSLKAGETKPCGTDAETAGKKRVIARNAANRRHLADL
jgi:hypothetical protein